MGGKTISTSETRIEALRLQSSAYGVVLPMLWGVNRITGNMIWYGGFLAIPHTTTQGGKGGGVKVQNTTYTYTAGVAMGICRGVVTSIPRIWRGKKLYSGGVNPNQILTATEFYTLPGSGAMVYTTTQAASFTSITDIRVTAPLIGTMRLSNGKDYSVANGVITFLNDAIRGKQATIVYQYTTGALGQSALDQLGLTLLKGEIGQSPWSGFASYGSASLGYSGTAYVASSNYDLGTGAQVENHNFEVIGPMAYHLGSSVPDVDPQMMLRDLLTDAHGGANFPSDTIDRWTQFSDFCVASGLLISPALVTQRTAAEIVEWVGRLTNSMPVWSGPRLKMQPRSDIAATGNGRTYTPSMSPVYALDDDAFTPAEGEPPIKITRRSPADRFNHVRVQYVDRSNMYNPAIAEARDKTDIDLRGVRSMDIIDAREWVCDTAVARMVAQLQLQRSLTIQAEYTFTLPWHYALIECGDVLTLTDSALGLSATGVLVRDIQEAEDGDLILTCEDFPAGSQHAPVYPSQGNLGYQHDYNVAPGNAGTPMIFEVPAELTATGLALNIAVPAGGANWGGAQIWASLDGTNYRMQGVVYGGARTGLVNGAVSGGASSIAVDGLGSQQLVSGSTNDATQLETLCYIGGANPEYFAYVTATLTGAGAYTLAGGLVHGAYGTPALAHADNDAFCRVDERVVRSEDLDPSFAGKTVYIKVCSFNLFGAAQQTLADVSATTYVVTGLMTTYRPAGGAQTFRQATAPVNPRVGTIWVNTTDGSQSRWSGTAWQPYAEINNTLIAHGTSAAGMEIGGNTVRKASGAVAWDAGVYSKQSFTGGAVASATAVSTAGVAMFALNTDPALDGSYASLDYAFHLAAGGTLEIYESGGNTGYSGTYAAGDAFDIVYDGATVAYRKNGVVLRKIVAASNQVLYFDSAFNTIGATLGNVSFGPVTPKSAQYSIATWGLDTTGLPAEFNAALMNVEAGISVASGQRSYAMARISRTTGLVTFSQVYDVNGNGAGTAGRNAATLATDLNNTDSSSVVAVWSYDEPKTNRLTGGLEAAMYRCGASRQVFGNESRFKYRSAYILVGIGGCGMGNGFETYAGDIDGDPANAFVRAAFFVTQGGNLIVNGQQYTFEPTIGGGNMLRNSSFEVDADANGIADNWTQYVAGTYGSITNTIAATGIAGSNVQRIAASNLGTSSSDQAGFYQIVNLNGLAGAACAFSAYALNASGGSPDLRLYIDFYSGANGTGSVTGVLSQVFPSIPATWNRYVVKGAIPAGSLSCIVYMWMTSRKGAAGASALDLDAVQFELGVAETAYAPRADELLTGVVSTVHLGTQAATDAFFGTHADGTIGVSDDGSTGFFSNSADLISDSWTNNTGLSVDVQFEASIQGYFTGTGAGTKGAQFRLEAWKSSRGTLSFQGALDINSTYSSSNKKLYTDVRQVTVANGETINCALVGRATYSGSAGSTTLNFSGAVMRRAAIKR